MFIGLPRQSCSGLGYPRLLLNMPVFKNHLKPFVLSRVFFYLFYGFLKRVILPKIHVRGDFFAGLACL